MTFQQPAFMVAHRAAVSAITDFATINSNTFSDDSKRALLDSNQGLLGSFTATTASAGFSLDMDAGRAGYTFNRLVIPAGHTFAGFDVVVEGDATGPTLPAPVRTSTILAVAAEVLDFPITSSVGGPRWWGIKVLLSATEVFSLGEFWLGHRRALATNDARIDTGWERSYEHDLSEDTFGGRTVTLELSPPRRKFSLKVRDLNPSGTDFDILDEVIRDGRSAPFWYWTPDTTDTGPYLVRLTGAATRVQASTVPTKSVRYEMTIEMLEETA